MSLSRITLAVGLVALFLPITPAQGQDPQAQMAEVQELVRQIRRNMVEAEREVDRTQAEAAKEASDTSKKKIEELIEQLKGRGGQITKDIDEVIEKLPRGGGGGGGGGGQQQQSQGSQGQQDQSGSRDRNQRENEGQDGQQNQNQNQNQNNQQNQGNNDSNGENPNSGANNRGNRPQQPPTENIQAPDDAERWGFLPKELRQRLIDRNYREFTPEYQREIKNYFRRLSKPRR